MLQRITSYLNRGFDFYGIEIYEDNEKTYFQVSHVRQTKKELLILKDYLFSTWDELFDVLNKNTPICLSYNCENVLDKIIASTENLASESLIEQTFPNLDFTRFYFNITRFKKNIYISIVEKKTIKTVVQRFNDAQLKIIDLNFGHSALSSTKPYLNTTSIVTNSKKIVFSENSDDIPNISKYTSFNKSPILYSVNGLEVKNSSLLSFSNVLNHLISKENIATNYTDLKRKLLNDAKYARRFQVLLWPIITGFLVLLLINFFVFNFYFQKLEVLNQDSSGILANKAKLIELKEVVGAKQIRVEAILGSKNSKATLILDKIAGSVPNTILLDNIVYQPLLKPLRDSKSIELDFNTIKIVGESGNSDDFSNWIDNIEDFKWVALVETIDYGFKTKNRSYFTLKLTIDVK